MPRFNGDDLDKEQFLYLTTGGRVTGKPREIEIWFVQDNGKFYVLSERFHDSQWVKNIAHEPTVHIRINGNVMPACARILHPEKDEGTWNRAQHLSRQKYGWGEGLPVELVPIQVE